MALLSGFLQVAVVYAFLVLVSYRLWHRLPDPLGHDADHGVFSEARAMAHVRELADEIGGRQVGTNGVREAARYLLGNLRDIERVARETRDDLDVEIAVDSVSGSYHLDLFLTPMYLTYANLENVMLKVTPKSAERSGSALLVNAHFDSAIASPGAADCAACTAIAVEVARTIVSNQSLSLESPVIFLLNGGEETYMNAAHGFLISHPWARHHRHGSTHAYCHAAKCIIVNGRDARPNAGNSTLESCSGGVPSAACGPIQAHGRDPLTRGCGPVGWTRGR